MTAFHGSENAICPVFPPLSVQAASAH